MTQPLQANDDILIQQFKNGQVDAFNTLYERYLPNVYKRVRYIIPQQDVEDVTQDVFIAAFKSLASFRGESQFSTWLRTLTNHKVAEYYRRRNRKKEINPVSLHEAMGVGDGRSAGLLEEQISIKNALQDLPENYREVLILRFAEDMQFNEIAKVMGQNMEAVKSLFRRALAALRNQLEKEL